MGINVARMRKNATQNAVANASAATCSPRSRTCTQLTLAAGIRRTVLALREPPVFVDCEGVELLQHAGVEIVEIPALADQVRAVNAGVLGDWSSEASM